MNSKEQAARHALSLVRDGMVLGLGSGSTATYFINLLSSKLAKGALRNIRAVPTSKSTAAAANELGIPLTSLSRDPVLDLAVDGADEVDPQLNLIKGLGKALLREKLVASCARKFVVIVDDSKLVDRLGLRGPLPVEILPFEAWATVNWLNSLGCQAELWLENEGVPAVTDNGNYLARCHFDKGIRHPRALARKLADRPGVIEHGLFLGMATMVIAGGHAGIRVLERSS